MEDLIKYVFEDDVSLRVKDDYQITENFYVGDYMRGRCHLFALMASEYLQAPLQAYLAPHPNFGFCLSHVFCKINNNTIFDASGLWNLYSAKNIYDEPGIYLMTDGFRLKQSLHEMIKQDELPSFFVGEKEKIFSYLDKMKKLGCMDLLLKENEPLVPIEYILNQIESKKTKFSKKILQS